MFEEISTNNMIRTATEIMSNGKVALVNAIKAIKIHIEKFFFAIRVVIKLISK